MDLLGSILSSMDKPPTASELEKKKNREMKAKLEKQQAAEKRKRETFRAKIISDIGSFVGDAGKKSFKFDPMDKIHRSIIHEISETAGLLAYSFGTEEVDRHIVVYKKEYVPSEEELAALRRGEEYDPQSSSAADTTSTTTTTTTTTTKELTKQAPPGHSYQDKYRHLIGAECAEKSAVKMQPKKQFGYVPSANKRDIRSIEETLQDIRSKKKARLDQKEEKNELGLSDSHRTSSPTT